MLEVVACRWYSTDGGPPLSLLWSGVHIHTNGLAMEVSTYTWVDVATILQGIKDGGKEKMYSVSNRHIWPQSSYMTLYKVTQ